MAPYYTWGSAASRLQSHYEEAVYFLPLSSQKFMVLIWWTSEGWKAESTLATPSGFEHGTPGSSALTTSQFLVDSVFRRSSNCTSQARQVSYCMDSSFSWRELLSALSLDNFTLIQMKSDQGFIYNN